MSLRSLTVLVITAVLGPYSIMLFSCKPGRKPGFRSGLRHAVDHLSTFFVENLVAAGSLVSARARQTECRKNRFEPANEPVEAAFSLRILLFVFIMT